MKHYKFNNEFMTDLLNKIQKENKKSIITGDFNMNLIKYTKSTGINQFLEHFFSYGYLPQITLPTRVSTKSATLIDNIFINESECKCVSGNITTSISDHLPQFIILKKFKDTSQVQNEITINRRDFKNFNIDSFKKDIEVIEWSLATENTDTDLGFETFLRLFDKVLDRHAPFKQLTVKERKEKLKPWVTNGIKSSMKVRDKLYKQMIKTKCVNLKKQKETEFKKYRNKIVDLLKISKHSYYQRYFEENKKNFKAIWQGIHDIVYSKKSKTTNSPSSIIIKGNTVTKPQDIAEHFNEFFTSIGKNLQENIPPTKKRYSNYLKNPNPDSFFISATTPEEVSDVIMTLKSNKSTGPNSIPTNILKEIKEMVSIPLSHLINKSFTSGIFPKIFKLAKIVPIFKSETRLAINNYRPISLLSNISKIIEKLMHQRLNQFLELHNCFYAFQFGFRLNYSTNNALMSIVENIQTQLDNGKFAAGIFVDLKKAFDTVDHEILVNKLEYYGIRGNAKEWFASYLRNRKQFVSIDNFNSSTKLICTGVPQGSVLGPLLFLIYINDLHKCVKYSKTYHFADDTNILLSNRSLETLAKRMNQDLKNLTQWLKANKLSLNVKKTELMIFRPSKKKIDKSIKFKLDGKRLFPTESVKYLGVLLDEHLQWNKQIKHVKTKLSRAIGILSRLRHNTNLNVLKIAYHSIFGSHLQYGS